MLKKEPHQFPLEQHSIMMERKNTSKANLPQNRAQNTQFRKHAAPEPEMSAEERRS